MSAITIGLGRVGGGTLRGFGTIGSMLRLWVRALWWAAVGPFRSRVLSLRLVTVQMERVGVHSAPLTCLVAALIGVILVLQTATTLREYGQLQMVPQMVAVSLVRELGPLLTALILAGRVGAAFTAEIGTMVVAEEVQALETMGVPPVAYLVAPRLVACITMVPCLTLCADAVGMLGGYVMAATQLGIDHKMYLDSTAAGLQWRDLIVGEAKAVVFGSIIAITACHRALRVGGSADEVGRATMQSVVLAMVLIIAANSVFAAVVNAWF